MPSLVGYFLVARPVLDDKNFNRSVILLPNTAQKALSLGW